jgi:hypothetical protein
MWIDHSSLVAPAGKKSLGNDIMQFKSRLRCYYAGTAGCLLCRLKVQIHSRAANCYAPRRRKIDKIKPLTTLPSFIRSDPPHLLRRHFYFKSETLYDQAFSPGGCLIPTFYLHRLHPYCLSYRRSVHSHSSRQTTPTSSFHTPFSLPIRELHDIAHDLWTDIRRMVEHIRCR